MNLLFIIIRDWLAEVDGTRRSQLVSITGASKVLSIARGRLRRTWM